MSALKKQKHDVKFSIGLQPADKDNKITFSSHFQVDMRKDLTQKDVARALDELRGATKIVFPAGLPPHDPVRMELDNVEDLSGTQAALEVMDPARACLWVCGKKMLAGNLLSDHLGEFFSSSDSLSHSACFCNPK